MTVSTAAERAVGAAREALTLPGLDAGHRAILEARARYPDESMAQIGERLGVTRGQYAGLLRIAMRAGRQAFVRHRADQAGPAGVGYEPMVQMLADSDLANSEQQARHTVDGMIQARQLPTIGGNRGQLYSPGIIPALDAQRADDAEPPRRR